MRLKSKTTATLLIAIFMISALTVVIPVMSVEPFDSYETAIIAAADRLVAVQNTDGGWDWGPPNENPNDVSPYNTIGVTAQGILDAYRLESKPSYLAACTNAYTLILAFSTDVDPIKHRIRGPDISFLVELSEVTLDSTYAVFAKGRYDSALVEYGGVTATGLAEFVRDGRIGQGLPGLISWDINFYVQGALALERYYPGEGYLEDAVAMTNVIYDALYVSTVLYDPTVGAQEDYGLALSGALEAFVTTETHETEASALEASLLLIQDVGGRFRTWVYINDVQTTAYAVMALLKTDNLVASIAAGNYFVGQQELSGAFETDENSEANSEVVQALYDIFTYVTEQSVSVTASVRPPVISIIVSPTSVDFGTIISGRSSDPVPITVTNNGEVNIIVTANTEQQFYQDFLNLNGEWADGWDLGPIPYEGTTFEQYTMQLVAPTSVGTHNAVLVFEATPPAP